MPSCKAFFFSIMAAEDLIFGVRAVEEAFRSGQTIEKLFVIKEGGGTALQSLTREAREREVPVAYVPLEKLNRLTRGNHQGVIAVSSSVVYQDLESVLTQAINNGKTPLVLILDRVTDVRNLGAIARSAECAGATCLIIPKQGAAQINSDAMKTSAGALNYLPVCRVANLVDAILLLQTMGIQVLATDDQGRDTLYQKDLSLPTAFILGNEEEGVSPTLLRRTDALVKIPLTGKVSSLNVSVAAGVCLFESLRQRA